MKIYCEICMRLFKCSVLSNPSAATRFYAKPIRDSIQIHAVCSDHVWSRYTKLWEISREEYLTECLKEAL